LSYGHKIGRECRANPA